MEIRSDTTFPSVQKSDSDSDVERAVWRHRLADGLVTDFDPGRQDRAGLNCRVGRLNLLPTRTAPLAHPGEGRRRVGGAGIS